MSDIETIKNIQNICQQAISNQPSTEILFSLAIGSGGIAGILTSFLVAYINKKSHEKISENTLKKQEKFNEDNLTQQKELHQELLTHQMEINQKVLDGQEKLKAEIISAEIKNEIIKDMVRLVSLLERNRKRETNEKTIEEYKMDLNKIVETQAACNVARLIIQNHEIREFIKIYVQVLDHWYNLIRVVYFHDPNKNEIYVKKEEKKEFQLTSYVYTAGKELMDVATQYLQNQSICFNTNAKELQNLLIKLNDP